VNQQPISVEVATLTRRTTAEVARASELAARTRTERIVVDMRGLPASVSARYQVSDGMHLASVIGGSNPSIDYSLHVDSRHLSMLGRCGVLFALANRSNGRLVLEDGNAIDGLEAWRNDWPGEETVMGLPGIALRPPTLSMASPECWSFVNPHRHLTQSEFERFGTFGQEAPWVRSLVDRFGQGLAGSEHEHLCAETSLIVNELVKNLFHAFRGMTSGEDRHRARSLVQLWATKGTPNRLHILALDFGMGIVKTLRPKLREPLRRSSSPSILERLLLGQIEPYDNGSGEGYQRIASVLRRAGGEVAVVTPAWGDQSHRSKDRLANLADDSMSIMAIQRRRSPISLQLLAEMLAYGTGVHISIELPRKERTARKRATSVIQESL
jgi:hypothetical protein